tara:strand:- start:660 stop:842 length:183 start_codon:yes stop_codon:yes gene_type:complete
MIIVKKEYLNIKLGSRRLTLGELNQRQLEHTKNVFGDKYFETETTKKTVKTKKKSDTSDS